MKIKRPKIKQVLLKGLSALFVFWLSSVLVLVCCGTHLFRVTAMKAEPESCPLKGHECCKKKSKTDDTSPKISENKDKTIDCCTFKPTKTLSANLQNSKNTKQSPAINTKVQTPKPVYFIRQTFQQPQVFRSAIRNRGSTYLQNCNFRI